MVDNLVVLSGYQECIFRNNLDAVGDLADSTYIRDTTDLTGSNWCANATLGFVNHLWLDKFFPTAGHQIDSQTCQSGNNEYGGTIPIDNVEITLDIANWDSDLTYGDLEYANYGVISFIDNSGFQQPVQWINFPKSVIYPVKQLVLGFRMFLKQGLKGTFNVYDQSSVPPLAWNNNGNLHDFDPYHGKII